MVAAIEGACFSQREAIIQAELQDRTFDVTLPGIRPTGGTMHPLSQVQERLEELFIAMGYHGTLDYLEVEDEFHNLEALNIPADHPARDMHDTPLDERPAASSRVNPYLSRQIRGDAYIKPPFRAVFPGKVFRYEGSPMASKLRAHISPAGRPATDRQRYRWRTSTVEADHAEPNFWERPHYSIATWLLPFR